MSSSAASIQPLKVLLLTNLYPPQVLGGYERSMADFARLLQHRGHEVLVLTSNTPELSAVHESIYPDPPVDRGLTLLGEWSSEGAKWFPEEKTMECLQHNQSYLQTHINAFQPDLCLAGNLDFLQTSTELLNVLLEQNIPIAHYVMNAYPSYSQELTPQQSIYRFISCSNWVISSMAALGYPVATAQTIYPGADVNTFYQAELPPHDRLRIVYASLVAPYKGADVLVEALSVLNAVGVDFVATIAGGTFQPEFVAALEEFVAAEELQDKVKFVGALSRHQLRDLFRTHNVLVFPSRFQEPFGISQIEAMAAGLTLVTSGTGGALEILEESGKDGIIFESENPLDLANALSSLVTDNTRWDAITRRGQQRAIAEFSYVKATEQLEAVFAELLYLKNCNLQGKIYHVGDYRILLPLSHALDRDQATWHRYDTALGYIAQAVFAKYPDSCAIDIGANVGDSAALIRTYADVPVLCVEGSPVFLEYLQHNAPALKKVKIEACFVGRDYQSVECDSVNYSSGTATIANVTESGSPRAIPMKRLSSVIQAHPEFTDFKLLKIDTDGFDFSIIQDSVATLSTSSPVLYFEYDIAFNTAAHKDAIETIHLLCTHGYTRFLVYDNFGNYLISVNAENADRFSDLTAYLISNRFRSGTPVTYYFDICAFAEHDFDLFQSIRHKEITMPLNITGVK